MGQNGAPHGVHRGKEAQMWSKRVIMGSRANGEEASGGHRGERSSRRAHREGVDGPWASGHQHRPAAGRKTHRQNGVLRPQAARARAAGSRPGRRRDSPRRGIPAHQHAVLARLHLRPQHRGDVVHPADGGRLGVRARHLHELVSESTECGEGRACAPNGFPWTRSIR